MKQTRFEIMKELRCTLNQSEETEHLIDWILDAWETYDLLMTLVGKERAHQMINAIEIVPDSIPHDMTAYNSTNEHANQYRLNERYFFEERKP